MNQESAQERSYLAAQWVLGLLDESERAQALAAIDDQQEWRRAQTFWEDRFHGLTEGLKPETPPNHVWNHIERAVESQDAEGGLWRHFFQSVRFWRPVALMATAAALILFFYARAPVGPPAVAPTQVAMLGASDQAPQFMVAVDPQSHRMTVKAMGKVDLPSGKSLELWMLPGGDAPPLSCGVLPKEGKSSWEMKPKEIEAMKNGNGLAVSLEPEGGSATGGPTGPVLYQAQFVTL